MISEWANAHGHEITLYNSFLGELPKDLSFDLLIVLGGPLSANENIDWLDNEKDFIQKALSKDKLILGICLGAQLIAKLLGAKIARNSVKEIGWFPITCADNFLSPTLKVFHWHGETFDLPKDSELLASSEACKNQAFAYKDNVLGLQFHLEMNLDSLNEIITHCSDELVAGKYIQNKRQILGGEANIDETRKVLYDVLDGLALRAKEDKA